jgi:uncharacterized protein YgbK (DUF1537 family)
VLLVGSAGWAEQLALACKGWIADVSTGPGVLGVVGSLSAIATRQVQVASQAGVMVVPFPTARTSSLSGEIAQDWQAMTDTLRSGRPVIFWTNPDPSSGVARPGGPRVLRSLAGTVREVLSTTPVKGLVIVGGDTAQAVFRALRASGLVLVGEVAPGVPYGRLLGGPCAGLPTVTKAGGFGADTALVEGLRFLQSWTG